MDFDPFSERFFDDPMPVYAWLRAESPAHYLEEFDTFFLSRFQDIWDATSDTRLSGGHGTTSNELLLGQQMNPGVNLARMDRPLHTAMRSELVRDFLPAAARRLEPHVRSRVRGYLDELAPTGGFDVVGEFSMRLTVDVACTLLGVPYEDASFLAEQVRAFFSREAGTRGRTESGRSATSALWEYLGRWIDERRESGEQRDDILGRLLRFEYQGERLGQGDLVSMLQLIVVGSTETLPKAFAGAVWQLAQHPDQRALLAKEPARIPTAFTEVLRYDMPTQFMARTVMRPVELHGQKLVPGQGVLILLAAANRDPREFPDPDCFDVERNPRRILSFGHAVHICLGAHVARLEGRILLEELLARFPNYGLDETQLEWRRADQIQGIVSAPIELTRAGHA